MLIKKEIENKKENQIINMRIKRKKENLISYHRGSNLIKRLLGLKTRRLKHFNFKVLVPF